MTRIAIGFALVSVALLASDHAAAVVAPSTGAAPGLRAAGGLRVRAEPSIVWHRTPPSAARAWQRFTAAHGGRWWASWDAATRVPSRIYGSGLEAPGASANPALAEMVAADVLRDHIDLLAPGSAPSDFVVVSNDWDGDMRTIGMVQHYRGVRVLGGQVSFRFKNDRLFVIGSEALPHVRAPVGEKPVDVSGAINRAERWIEQNAAVATPRGGVDGPFVLPLVGDGGVRAYAYVVRVVVDAERPRGRWNVYLDAVTGALVAREQTLRFATGTLLYDVPVRWPGDGRATYPARNTAVDVNGIPATSDVDGVITWPGEAAASLVTRVHGPFVRVVNDAGTEAFAMLDIADGETLVWDETEADGDAQLATYIHARVAKDYARRFATGLPFLEAQQSATVNIDDQCNAFSDGEGIYFFRSSTDCENTGRLADVVYHEFGHSLHRQSMIEGVGAFDGAFSEGLSDYLAATITGDPAMGRGFFYDDEPIRDIDPDDMEHRWPDDIAEIHYTGLIFAGAMWDLRERLRADLGDTVGVRHADQLFYAATRRATNIPSTYVEILAADDDDGDLANGTPNLCAINTTFGAHGLRALAITLSELGREPAGEDGYPLAVTVEGLTGLCPGDSIAGADIEWEERGGSGAGTVPLVDADGALRGVLPPQEDGTVLRYQVALRFADGTARVFPENPADRYLELFVGDVVELYCTDFESDPFAGEAPWTHGLTRGTEEQGADDWMWGAPQGIPASGDPDAAYSGESVLGNDLGGGEFNGSYKPDKTNYAATPAIDVGAYTDVRLQYRRWLNVEDAYYDTATIYANGEPVWQNLNSDQGDYSSIHHMDRTWVFHDVPLSEHIPDGAVRVSFEISSDGGLEMGGWTLDDVCVVALASSVCGDDVVTGVEECDEGDANDDTLPDACRTNCRVARCGDGVVDTPEMCDDGNDDELDECNSSCYPTSGGGGCCDASGGSGPAGALVLALLVAVALTRLERRTG